jgi:archaellum component FlaC
VAYFSFGEKLPVIDQGTNDPQGLGYTYQTLSALIARKLEDAEELVNNRSEFVRVASCHTSLLKKSYQEPVKLDGRVENDMSNIAAPNNVAMTIDAPRFGKKYRWVFLFLAVLGTGSVAWWFYPDRVNTQLAEIKSIIAKYLPQPPEKDTPQPPPGPSPSLPLSVQRKLDEILNRLNKLEQELAKNGHSDNQIKELKEQLKQISDFLKRVGNTTEDITAKVSDLYDKLETSSPDVQTLQQTMTNVLQEIVKPDVDKLRDKFAQLQAAVNEYHTETARINQKLAELGQRIAKGNLQATEIASMVGDLQMNNVKLEAMLSEIKQIKETLPAKTELAEFKQRVESLELKMENMELKRTIEAMIQENQNAEVKQQLEALATQVTKPKVVIIDLKQLFGLVGGPTRNCLTLLPPEFQKMLSMSLVDIQGQPVPDNLKEWMKDMKDSQVSESPFYIMRREVTIAEFRRYVNQLSSTQQEDLGNKWQEDNCHGGPLTVMLSGYRNKHSVI